MSRWVATSTPAPVFLHSVWRSGGTYIWSRFRAEPRALAFYDPLNIDLAKLTRAKLAGATPAASPHLRHPELRSPYFAEYAPLLRRWGLAGVAGYRRSLAVERLVLEPTEPHPELRDYISGLVGAGGDQKRAPVLSLTWSFGRIAWLAARFTGRHIHVDRAPEAMFGSVMDQLARGNPWFVARSLIMIEANREHPWLAPLAERLPLRNAAQRLVPARKHYYRRLARELPASEVYRLTFHTWALAALQGLAHADAVVDMDQMGAATYRTEAARRLQDLTGLAVDFSDARVPEACGPTLDDLIRRRIESEVLRSLPLPSALERETLGRRRNALTARKAALLSTVI